MSKYFEDDKFETINKAYNTILKPNKLTLGFVVPIESYPNSLTPSMQDHIQRVQFIERLGFSSVWLRDIPFNVPSFGDAGQIFDPFVYLGFLSAHTKTIALGTGSIILPLRHPAHVAKSAASVDALSGGRLILGVASGDRPQEYPALNIPFENRGDKFRESFEYIKNVWENNPNFQNEYGTVYGGMDMLPKPTAKKVPMLITGASQQNQEWLSSHGEGWITYPRNPLLQGQLIENWRKNAKASGSYNKPVSQSLYIDLLEDKDAKVRPIHLGYRLGTKELIAHLKALEEVGVNHVVLNLRFNQADIETTLKRLAEEVLPEFN
jgi:luciferase-type oxidoreductase